MIKPSITLTFASVLLFLASPAHSQPGQDFPEGPGKDKVVAVCNGCHDINRAKAGYTPAKRRFEIAVRLFLCA